MAVCGLDFGTSNSAVALPSGEVLRIDAHAPEPRLFRTVLFFPEDTADVLAGQRAELGTILVRTGKGGQDGEFDVEPHFVEDDFYNAIARVNQFEYSLRV